MNGTEATESRNRYAEPFLFNSAERFVEGWYWAIRSRELRAGQVKALVLNGRNLAAYRTTEGRAVVVDAYCPHMGAHLAEGTVEGDGVRCFFHNWKFGPGGECVDVPSLGRPVKACVRSWPVEERYGMVWVWTGLTPTHPVPFDPELADLEDAEIEPGYGNDWVKECHPNVVMVNAIDAHHFNTVHQFPVAIDFECAELESGGITFTNRTRGGDESWFVRMIRPFYKDAVTYKLCYWSGSTGTVCVGPDFLHFYIMFTSRLGEDGRAEGRTILLTRRRRGPMGWLANRVILFLTKLVGDYFAKGDTEVFRTIRFKIQTPVKPDRPILQFVDYVEGHRALSYGGWEVVEPPRRLEAVPTEEADDAVA